MPCNSVENQSNMEILFIFNTSVYPIYKYVKKIKKYKSAKNIKK